jgi:hypothetical protein
MVREISEVTIDFRDDRGCAPSGLRTWRTKHDACVDLPPVRYQTAVRHETGVCTVRYVPDRSTARAGDSGNEAVLVFCLLQNGGCLLHSNTSCTEPLGTLQTRGRALQCRLLHLDGRRPLLAPNPCGPQRQASAPTHTPTHPL